MNTSNNNKKQQDILKKAEIPIMPESENPHKSHLHRQKWVLLLVIGILTILLLTGYFIYQDLQLNLKKAEENMERAKGTPTPIITIIPTPERILRNITAYPNTATYENFSIWYSDDWHVIDNETSDDPLITQLITQRLTPLFDKVIALQKNNMYLLVLIQDTTEGSAGGILVNNEHYNEFVSIRDAVYIENFMFYLTKTNHEITSLIDSHGGPYTWSSLSEYIPEKQVESGEIYKGHEDVIERSGNNYVIIVASDTGGETDPDTQQEIISMLETIEW